MTRRSLLAAAALLSLSMTAGSANAETQAEVEQDGPWRVVFMVFGYRGYSGVGGIDSFAVEGGLEECRSIAKSTGSSYPLEDLSWIETLCLNTVTGEATSMGKWKP